jgi:hypothetical protein
MQAKADRIGTHLVDDKAQKVVPHINLALCVDKLPAQAGAHVIRLFRRHAHS